MPLVTGDQTLHQQDLVYETANPPVPPPEPPAYPCREIKSVPGPGPHPCCLSTLTITESGMPLIWNTSIVTSVLLETSLLPVGLAGGRSK